MAISERMQVARKAALAYLANANALMEATFSTTLRPEEREMRTQLSALVQEAERVFHQASTDDELLTAMRAIWPVLREMAEDMDAAAARFMQLANHEWEAVRKRAGNDR